MSENLETLYGSVLQCANFAEYWLVLSLNDYIGIYKFVLRALIQTIIPGQGRKREMEQRWSRNKVTLSPGDNKLSRREDTVYWTETRVEKQAPSFCQSTALTNRTANLYTNFWFYRSHPPSTAQIIYTIAPYNLRSFRLYRGTVATVYTTIHGRKPT